MPSKKAATKKTTPAKKSPSQIRKTTTPKEIPQTTSRSLTLPTTMTNTVTRRNIAIILVVIILACLLYLARGLFVAALVNGHPIYRLSVVNQLEKQAGKQTLDTLITEKLIENEAAKRNISVSQNDVNNQIATIQRNIQSQGSTLDQALAQQGMTRNDLTEQVKLQLMLNKMIKTPTVSDKQISDYMSQNKDQLPQGESDAQLKSQIKQQLMQQQQQQASQALVQQLRSNAKITYFVNY